MTLDNFINKTIKTGVDFDGAYGAQCVDLFRQYAKDVLEIKEHTGAVEGAKDLFLNYENMAGELRNFDKRRWTCKPKVGDIAVWDGTPQNKYGHVAIVIAEVGELLLVYEQDGTKKPGDEKYGARFALRSRYRLLGYLRKKEA